MSLLERAAIEQALRRLSDRLMESGQRAELFLVGGAVMCLVYEARPATKDVDGWFTNPQAVRTAASEVAEELGLPANWLNDAAKGFVPSGAAYESWMELPALSVSHADPRTLLAMKCAAARTDQDAEDIRFLIGHLGLKTSAEVLDLCEKFFPAQRLSVKSQLLVEEIFDERR